MLMKILFLALDVNIKSKTGDAVHVREEVASLAKIGNEVTLIAPQTDGPEDELKSLQNQDNINLYFNKPKKYFRNLKTVLFCRKIAKKHGSIIIYERRFTPKIGYTLSKILRIPLIVEINGLTDKEAEIQNIAKTRNIIPKTLRKRIWRHMFKSVKRVVVVSLGLKSGLTEEYGLKKDKIDVIYNGANTELFKPMDIVKCKEDLELNIKHRYVGFIGNLAPWQGVEQLIEIAPKVIEKIPEARFLIVGDGLMRPQLESSTEKLGIRDKVIFTGFIPYASVPKYINTFEVCAAPFSGIERNVKYSFSAIKLYEYMACGKPVVTTDVVGIKEEINQLGLGKIVKADDTHAFRESIIEILDNPELQIEYGEKARDWVLKEHSWQNVAERVQRVCLNVISGTATI
ncbi:MAG: glycosyltransferase family 4 protein [Thermoplasmata archaeon]|nr:MAG: glycosyltransferase family 4 protein [Thermoplasmata archaeon]